MSEPLLVIRPKRSLLATAFVSIMLATAPIFAVLYWLTGSITGVWVPVLITHLALFFGGVGLFLRQLMVRTAVTETELFGNGIFSPTVRVQLDDIAEVIVVDTHVGGLSTEPVQQYLVRDAEQRCIYRLRGDFWHRADLEALLDALPVEPTRVTRPMPIRDFFATYPGSAYWFENRPWLRALAAIAAGLVVVALLVWALEVIGQPLFD